MSISSFLTQSFLILRLNFVTAFFLFFCFSLIRQSSPEQLSSIGLECCGDFCSLKKISVHNDRTKYLINIYFGRTRIANPVQKSITDHNLRKSLVLSIKALNDDLDIPRLQKLSINPRTNPMIAK